MYPTVWNSAHTATDSLAKRASETPDGVIKVNRFLREVCLDTVGQAAFSIDLEVLARPEQEMTRKYLRAFDTGEKAPLFLKLLQELFENEARKRLKRCGTAVGLHDAKNRSERDWLVFDDSLPQVLLPSVHPMPLIDK